MTISDVVVHDNRNAFCSFTDDSVYNSDVSAAFLFPQLLLPFIAPLVGITVLYTAIAIALKRKNRTLSDTG